MNQPEHVKQALRLERRYYGVIWRYDDGSFMVPGARFTSFLRQNTLDEYTRQPSAFVVKQIRVEVYNEKLKVVGKRLSLDLININKLHLNKIFFSTTN